MTEKSAHVTSGIRFLREKGIQFEEHVYRYEKEDPTGAAARALGVDEHVVVKTLVMEDERGEPLIVLMHGDLQVSTKNLARAIGSKSVKPSSPRDAERFTGYMVGGISPFGTRRRLPVYVEKTILDEPKIYINAGRRGLLVGITPADLVKSLSPKTVNVAA